METEHFKNFILFLLFVEVSLALEPGRSKSFIVKSINIIEFVTKNYPEIVVDSKNYYQIYIINQIDNFS